jgi:predicted RNA-binding Zn-ribbon protein involved in translation (DUF1610 family)
MFGKRSSFGRDVLMNEQASPALRPGSFNSPLTYITGTASGSRRNSAQVNSRRLSIAQAENAKLAAMASASSSSTSAKIQSTSMALLEAAAEPIGGQSPRLARRWSGLGLETFEAADANSNAKLNADEDADAISEEGPYNSNDTGVLSNSDDMMNGASSLSSSSSSKTMSVIPIRPEEAHARKRKLTSMYQQSVDPMGARIGTGISSHRPHYTAASLSDQRHQHQQHQHEQYHQQDQYRQPPYPRQQHQHQQYQHPQHVEHHDASVVGIEQPLQHQPQPFSTPSQTYRRTMPTPSFAHTPQNVMYRSMTSGHSGGQGQGALLSHPSKHSSDAAVSDSDMYASSSQSIMMPSGATMASAFPSPAQFSTRRLASSKAVRPIAIKAETKQQFSRTRNTSREFVRYQSEYDQSQPHEQQQNNGVNSHAYAQHYPPQQQQQQQQRRAIPQHQSQHPRTDVTHGSQQPFMSPSLISSRASLLGNGLSPFNFISQRKLGSSVSSPEDPAGIGLSPGAVPTTFSSPLLQPKRLGGMKQERTDTSNQGHPHMNNYMRQLAKVHGRAHSDLSVETQMQQNGTSMLAEAERRATVHPIRMAHTDPAAMDINRSSYHSDTTSPSSTLSVEQQQRTSPHTSGLRPPHRAIPPSGSPPVKRVRRFSGHHHIVPGDDVPDSLVTGGGGFTPTSTGDLLLPVEFKQHSPSSYAYGAAYASPAISTPPAVGFADDHGRVDRNGVVYQSTPVLPGYHRSARSELQAPGLQVDTPQYDETRPDSQTVYMTPTYSRHQSEQHHHHHQVSPANSTHTAASSQHSFQMAHHQSQPAAVYSDHMHVQQPHTPQQPPQQYLQYEQQYVPQPQQTQYSGAYQEQHPLHPQQHQHQQPLQQQHGYTVVQPMQEQQLLSDGASTMSGTSKKKARRRKTKSSRSSSSAAAAAAVQGNGNQYASDNASVTSTSSGSLKKHSCPHCGKSFPGRVGLVRHLRVHTGEKPFKCDKCGRSFKQKGTLTSHYRIHTGEMPYKCNLCGTEFRHRGNLCRHERTCRKKHGVTDG